MQPTVNDKWDMWLRELRHNQCLMTPLSATIFITLAVFSLALLALRIPSMLIGIILAPLFSRSSWFVEFLYPSSLGRWGHLFLVRMSSKKSTKFRTLEQRMEVFPGQVYIHPIPQLLDNLGYLVVSEVPGTPLLGFLVDCGDAEACMKHVTKIRERHYGNQELDVQAVLCTHKHHDHTAGNQALVTKYYPNIKVYGAVAERVPHCTDFVSNGDLLTLPHAKDNNMNRVVQMEVISVPSHTRGSVAYVLRTKENSFMFTGDTMFSGGGGVPFEADAGKLEPISPQANSTIRASAGNHSVERCFAEMALRTQSDEDTANVLIFPGHEYTHELLHRQFMPSMSEWQKFSPAVFFRAASQLYVTSHRRTLPQGKILAVPSLLRMELDINPNFRKLRKRGEDVVRAVQLWYRLFAHSVIPNEGEGFVTAIVKSSKKNGKTKQLQNLESSEDIWNVKADDLTKPIFTAVYTADLDIIIAELGSGKIRVPEAVKKLQAMRDRAEEPVVRRRPIPATLPNDKIMYHCLLAFCILGCPPSAMTLSDAQSMNLPRPVSPANTHKLRISKTRILRLLKLFNLIEDTVEGRDLTTMIEYLWREAGEYGMPDNERDGEYGDCDEMELGVLRWMLFGIEATQPSWFKRYCMPCNGSVAPKKPTRKHPIHDAQLRRTNGELIKHDALTCLLCRDVTGCPLSDVVAEQEQDEDFLDEMEAKGNRSLSSPLGSGSRDEAEETRPPVFQRIGASMRMRSNSRPFDEDIDSVEVQVLTSKTF